MIRYKRPTRPDLFEETVAPFKTTIAKRIDALMKKAAKQAANKTPHKTTKKRAGRKKKSTTVKFKSTWKKYKDIFSYVQFGKCGFCEADVKKAGHGDVEHYYPKGEVWALFDSNGRRSKTVLSEMGYWWRAYDWTNYLFACPKCNQTYKGSYFPVRQRTRCLPPNERPTKKFPKETPLLLNPYDRLDPAKHLQFKSSGLVENRNRSLFGYETIRTCGLNRGRLVEAREQKALRADDLMQQFAQGNNIKNLTVLKDIYFLGRDSEEHAGMVRDLFRECGLNWDELVRRFAEAICGRLNTSMGPDASRWEAYLEQMGRERYEYWKMVRDIFEKSSKSKWRNLVQKRAEQLARELLDSQKKSDTAHVNLLEARFYEMGRESPSSLKTVANIFEAQTGQTWVNLERAVKRRSTF